MKNIEIDFEGRDEGCAFFSLYAGLRMYSELKTKQAKRESEVSIAGAEAYSILADLEESHPNECLEAKKEYEAKINLGLFDIVRSTYKCPNICDGAVINGTCNSCGCNW